MKKEGSAISALTATDADIIRRHAGRPLAHGRPLRVLKFGGTSMGTDSVRLAEVAQRVAEAHAEGGPTVVIVSARGATTDHLVSEAYAVSSAPEPREVDQLLATGEAAAAALLAIALNDLGVPAASLLGGQAGIMVRGAHLDGRIAHIDTTALRATLSRGQVPVVAGFQGLNRHADVMTLGRGGSDITAASLAVALGARACEIYTDVRGVFTADPRVVPAARLLARISNRAMAELARAGARVLHARSVDLAGRHRLDIHVRSAFSHEPGTVVFVQRDREKAGFRDPAAAIAHDPDAARVIIRSPSVCADMLTILAAEAVPVDMVAAADGRGSRGAPNGPGWGFTVAAGDVNRVRRILAPVSRDVEIDTSVAKLSLVGRGLAGQTRTPDRMLAALTSSGIEVHAVSGSRLRCSATVTRADCGRAVRLLHEEFRLDQELGCAAEGLLSA